MPFSNDAALFEYEMLLALDDQPPLEQGEERFVTFCYVVLQTMTSNMPLGCGLLCIPGHYLLAC
jgi:hypothetical protein